MKDQKDVIKEFNELVNVSAKDLENWLKSNDSRSAGWPKENGDGETVGHDSGKQIVEILKSNPKKDPSKYSDDQVAHMRKVVSYCKRHLAQEEKANDEKSIEEVKKTKSYASLMNWGHDCLKGREEQDNDGDDVDVDEDEDEDKDLDEEDSADGADSEENTGEKRKAPNDQHGANKKQEKPTKTSRANDGSDSEEEDDQDANDSKTNGSAANGHGKKETKDAGKHNKPEVGPEVGDTVSWNWGSGQPEGEVLEVKADKTTIQTKKGNEVSRKGKPEDPAVVLDTGKSKAIKLNHELNEQD